MPQGSCEATVRWNVVVALVMLASLLSSVITVSSVLVLQLENMTDQSHTNYAHHNVAGDRCGYVANGDSQ